MKKGILLLTALYLLIYPHLESKAQVDMDQLLIVDIQFPDTIIVGEVQLVSGIVTNISNEPQIVDFNFGVDFEDALPDSDFDYEYDELLPCNDCDLQPGESKTFSEPVFLSNQRVQPNQENIIIVWPSGVINDDQRDGQYRTRKFYAADNSEEIDRNANISDCNSINIERLEQVIKISGLFEADQSNISIVDQNHKVIYFCENNCPNDEIIVNIEDDGYYLVQVVYNDNNSSCNQSKFIITENWLNYEEYIMQNGFPDMISILENFSLPNIETLISNSLPDNAPLSLTEIIPSGFGDLNFPDLGGFNFPDLNDFNFPNIGELPISNLPDNDLPDLPDVSNQQSGISCSVNVVKVENTITFTKPTDGVTTIILTDALDKVIFECSGNTCNDNQIIVQLPELDEMMYNISVSYTNAGQVCNGSIALGSNFNIIDENYQHEFCDNQNLNQLPVINAIDQQTVSVVLPNFVDAASLQLRAENAKEWETIKNLSTTYLLTQLSECTTYEVRSVYVCNNIEKFSEIQTFTTQGCGACNMSDIDLRVNNIVGNITMVNWNFEFGANYRLHYKKKEATDWSINETHLPSAPLFNLDYCSTYEFYVEVKCAQGVISAPSEVVEMQTGLCKNTIGQNLEISIHPNPTTDILNLTINGENDINQVQIYNQAGLLMQQVNGSKIINGKYLLHVVNFPKGLYIIHAISNDTIYHTKFIKQ